MNMGSKVTPGKDEEKVKGPDQAGRDEGVRSTVQGKGGSFSPCWTGQHLGVNQCNGKGLKWKSL